MTWHNYQGITVTHLPAEDMGILVPSGSLIDKDSGTEADVAALLSNIEKNWRIVKSVLISGSETERECVCMCVRACMRACIQ